MKIVAMIPIKLHNERTPGKNTKCFFDGTPLMHFVQRSLLQVNGIDEIYCYCSDEKVKEYLLENVKFLKRPDYLDLPTSNFNDIFTCFIQTIPADIYVVVHATGPFIKIEHYQQCLDKVIVGGYDTAFTAKKIQDFLWNEKLEPINFDPQKLPRTQDLPPLYSETSGLYVISRDAYEKTGRRIGENPYICVVDEVEAIDIDYPEDFELADLIYKKIILKGE